MRRERGLEFFHAKQCVRGRKGPKAQNPRKGQDQGGRIGDHLGKVASEGRVREHLPLRGEKGGARHTPKASVEADIWRRGVSKIR